jgi:Restriction Enzyme Adenine Methylase Associated
MWDHFSIYLTIKDQHLREIEALLLRITKPPGAKQSGKLAQSKDMKRQIMTAIRGKLNREVSSLFDSFVHLKGEPNIKARGEASDLLRYLPVGGRLKGTNRGRTFRARARSDGKVRYNGRNYSSLTLAAVAAIKRPTNGWWFWQVERGKHNWVRLTKIRKAGTPVYTR